jgi:hypothetical protein
MYYPFSEKGSSVCQPDHGGLRKRVALQVQAVVSEGQHQIFPRRDGKIDAAIAAAASDV